VREGMLREAEKLQIFDFERGQRVLVTGLWVDEEVGVAVIDCNSGVWRLPLSVWGWARTARAQAAVAGGFPEGAFPCWVCFSYTARGAVEVDMLRPRAA
jgi:hypothetical protein